MKSNLERITDCFVLEQVFSTIELVRGSNGETRVQSDVFLVFWKTVIGDPELERFWNRRVELFHRFKGDGTCNFSCCKFR